MWLALAAQQIAGAAALRKICALALHVTCGVQPPPHIQFGGTALTKATQGRHEDIVGLLMGHSAEDRAQERRELCQSGLPLALVRRREIESRHDTTDRGPSD